MQRVEFSQWIPCEPALIYQFLTDPQNLAAVVGRIEEAEVIEREGETGKVRVMLDLPARKVTETIGDVFGVLYEQLNFHTHEPFPLEFQWQFIPQEQDGIPGTEVQASIGFDLSVFGMAIGGTLIRGIVLSELRADMKRLESELHEHYG